MYRSVCINYIFYICISKMTQISKLCMWHNKKCIETLSFDHVYVDMQTKTVLMDSTLCAWLKGNPVTSERMLKDKHVLLIPCSSVRQSAVNLVPTDTQMLPVFPSSHTRYFICITSVTLTSRSEKSCSHHYVASTKTKLYTETVSGGDCVISGPKVTFFIKFPKAKENWRIRNELYHQQAWNGVSPLLTHSFKTTSRDADYIIFLELVPLINEYLLIININKMQQIFYFFLSSLIKPFLYIHHKSPRWHHVCEEQMKIITGLVWKAKIFIN